MCAAKHRYRHVNMHQPTDPTPGHRHTHQSPGWVRSAMWKKGGRSAGTRDRHSHMSAALRGGVWPCEKSSTHRPCDGRTCEKSSTNRPCGAEVFY